MALLQRRALDPQIDRLGPGALELGLGLRDVGTRGDSAVVPVLRQAQQARLDDGVGRRRASFALCLEREVDHHDRVLLDDADQQDDADQRHHVQLRAGEQQGQEGADAGRRQGREDGDRVDVALVEHAQDEVDGDQRGQDQQRLVGERRLERLRGALEAAVDGGGQVERADRLGRGGDRGAQRDARREVERQGHYRELALVTDRERRGGLRHPAHGPQRHGAAVGTREIDVVEPRRRLSDLRDHLEHDAVLVQLREHGRDLALSEGVVERVVDHLRGDAEARRRRAVDRQRRLQSALLLVGPDVAQLGPLAQRLDHPRRPASQLGSIGILQAVLELRPAQAILDRQILDGLQVQPDAVHLRQRRLQAPDHRRRRHAALGERRERDLDPPAVQRRVRAVDADERRQALSTAGSRRITCASACCAFAMAANDTAAGASETPTISPVSCTGKNPFGVTA
jgi:hypothetical protein